MAGSSTPRASVVVISATAIVVVLIVTLWGFPGGLTGTSSCPAHPTFEGRAYCAEVTTVAATEPCNGRSICPECPPAGLVFHGASFNLTLTNDSGEFVVRGCVTETNSTMYLFGLWAGPFGPPLVNWTSPDSMILVEWQGPFPTLEDDGLLSANLTCGVVLATGEGP